MSGPSTVEATLAAFFEKLQSQSLLPPSVVDAIKLLASQDRLHDQGRLRLALEADLSEEDEAKEA